MSCGKASVFLMATKTPKLLNFSIIKWKNRRGLKARTMTSGWASMSPVTGLEKRTVATLTHVRQVIKEQIRRLPLMYVFVE